eukprot:g5666.t1
MSSASSSLSTEVQNPKTSQRRGALARQRKKVREEHEKAFGPIYQHLFDLDTWNWTFSKKTPSECESIIEILNLLRRGTVLRCAEGPNCKGKERTGSEGCLTKHFHLLKMMPICTACCPSGSPDSLGLDSQRAKELESHPLRLCTFNRAKCKYFLTRKIILESDISSFWTQRYTWLGSPNGDCQVFLEEDIERLSKENEIGNSKRAAALIAARQKQMQVNATLDTKKSDSTKSSQRRPKHEVRHSDLSPAQALYCPSEDWRSQCPRYIRDKYLTDLGWSKGDVGNYKKRRSKAKLKKNTPSKKVKAVRKKTTSAPKAARTTTAPKAAQVVQVISGGDSNVMKVTQLHTSTAVVQPVSPRQKRIRRPSKNKGVKGGGGPKSKRRKFTKKKHSDAVELLHELIGGISHCITCTPNALNGCQKKPWKPVIDPCPCRQKHAKNGYEPMRHCYIYYDRQKKTHIIRPPIGSQDKTKNKPSDTATLIATAVHASSESKSSRDNTEKPVLQSISQKSGSIPGKAIATSVTVPKPAESSTSLPLVAAAPVAPIKATGNVSSQTSVTVTPISKDSGKAKLLPILIGTEIRYLILGTDSKARMALKNELVRRRKKSTAESRNLVCQFEGRRRKYELEWTTDFQRMEKSANLIQSHYRRHMVMKRQVEVKKAQKIIVLQRVWKSRLLLRRLRKEQYRAKRREKKSKASKQVKRKKNKKADGFENIEAFDKFVEKATSYPRVSGSTKRKKSEKEKIQRENLILDREWESMKKRDKVHALSYPGRQKSIKAPPKKKIEELSDTTADKLTTVRVLAYPKKRTSQGEKNNVKLSSENSSSIPALHIPSKKKGTQLHMKRTSSKNVGNKFSENLSVSKRTSSKNVGNKFSEKPSVSKRTSSKNVGNKSSENPSVSKRTSSKNASNKSSENPSVSKDDYELQLHRERIAKLQYQKEIRKRTKRNSRNGEKASQQVKIIEEIISRRKEKLKQYRHQEELKAATAIQRKIRVTLPKCAAKVNRNPHVGCEKESTVLHDRKEDVREKSKNHVSSMVPVRNHLNFLREIRRRTKTYQNNLPKHPAKLYAAIKNARKQKKNGKCFCCFW